MSEDMPKNMSEYMPEDMSDKMPEDLPEDLPNRMPEDIPKNMPEDMPEDLPDRMPEDMPDRMPNKMSEDIGFFKKNSHPQETTELPCLPPQPPISMLWSDVPNIINRNNYFFWRPPNTQFRRQHWIRGRGGMTSAVWYFMGWLFFLKNPVRFFWVPNSF